MAKQLARQDRNGTRTSEELRRRYNLNQIELTSDEVEYLKKLIVVDSALSTTSTNAVQNKVITQALNNKVNAETGKVLTSNDFTDTLKVKLDGIAENAQVNTLETISVNGVQQAITNKNIDLQINHNFTQDYEDQITANTAARHTHANKNLLDTYTQTNTNLSNAVTNSHTHTNKTVLDGITSNDVSRWRNIAFYESGGATDVNTTIEELVISATNTPDTSLWYVQTFFYGSQSSTSNRMQIAYGYSTIKPTMSRIYSNGNWSEWTTGIEYNLTQYKVSALTITRSSCKVKNNRAVINLVGSMAISASYTTTLFNLPDGLKPSVQKDFLIYGTTSSGSTLGYGYITTAGLMQVWFPASVTSYIRTSFTYDID